LTHMIAREAISRQRRKAKEKKEGKTDGLPPIVLPHQQEVKDIFG